MSDTTRPTWELDADVGAQTRRLYDTREAIDAAMESTAPEGKA